MTDQPEGFFKSLISEVLGGAVFASGLFAIFSNVVAGFRYTYNLLLFGVFLMIISGLLLPSVWRIYESRFGLHLNWWIRVILFVLIVAIGFFVFTNIVAPLRNF